jgi:hypothetical protein
MQTVSSTRAIGVFLRPDRQLAAVTDGGGMTLGPDRTTEKAVSSKNNNMAAAAKPDANDWVFGKTAPISTAYALGKQLGQPGQFGVAKLATHKARCVVL